MQLPIKSLLSLTTCLALAAAALQTPTEEPPAPLPAGTLAQFGDSSVSTDEYKDYLLDLAGLGPLRDLVLSRQLELELERLGLEVPESAIDVEWTREETGLLSRSGGDMAQLMAELDQLGYGYAGYKRRFRATIFPKLAEDQIILATRTVEEPAIEEYYNRVFGEGGVKVTLRHLMLTRAKTRASLRQQGVPEAELTDARLDAAMLEKAQALLAELSGGADFESVARRESADLSVMQNGGVIPNYNYKHYGPELASAVRAAEVGVPSGPVITNTGLHLFVVEERVVTPLEEARAGIIEELQKAPASYPERSQLRQRLLREHPVQYAGPEAVAPR